MRKHTLTYTHTHVEETPPVLDFQTQKKCREACAAYGCTRLHALKGVHMFTEIYGMYVCMHVCTLTHMHRHTNSGAAALSGASVVMETRSDRVGVTAHVIRWGTSNTRRCPIFIMYAFRHITRHICMQHLCTHTHTHTHTHTQKLPLLFYGPEQREREREQRHGFRNGEARSKMKERLKRLRWGRKRGSVQGEGWA